MKHELESLKLFNEKAEKLLNSRFVKQLKEAKKLSVAIDIEKGKGVKVEKVLPDQDAIDAFVLTFRFFIQNNEECSFGNLNEAYQKLPISQGLKNEYFDVRKKLNDFLDKPMQVNIGERTPTRRQLLDIFVYGGLAHANVEKKKQFDEWKQTPIIGDIVEFEFCSTLEFVLRIILFVTGINSRAIEELQRTEK